MVLVFFLLLHHSVIGYTSISVSLSLGFTVHMCIYFYTHFFLVSFADYRIEFVEFMRATGT